MDPTAVNISNTHITRRLTRLHVVMIGVSVIVVALASFLVGRELSPGLFPDAAPR